MEAENFQNFDWAKRKDEENKIKVVNVTRVKQNKRNEINVE